MDSVTFKIPGRPKAWARAGRNGKRAFTPEAVRKKKAEVAAIAADVMRGRQLMAGPVELFCQFVFAIPKSWNRQRRYEAEQGLVLHFVRPDRDNLEKLVMDALNGVVWLDDSQVAIWSGSKVYGPEECAVVTVRALQLLGGNNA